MRRKASRIIAIVVVLATWVWISVLSLVGESILIASYPKVMQIVLLAFAGIFDTWIFILILAAATTIDTTEIEETKNIQ